MMIRKIFAHCGIEAKASNIVLHNSALLDLLSSNDRWQNPKP